MPSPFPGMDPYLEGSEWTSFHAEFAVEIARQLRPQLRPRYVALPVKRFITDTSEELTITAKSPNVYPDVGVAQISPYPIHTTSSPIATVNTPLQMETVMPERVPHFAVEVRDIENRQLVTLIEILSPANKRGKGYAEYIAKRQRVLLSTAHLMEIDLLRKGQRVPMRQSLPPAPYFVFLSRYERRPMTEIWPIKLNQPLPIVPIPLLLGDKDVTLDLQLVLTTIYDSVGYDLVLSYTKPPDVPLEEKAAEWAATLLKNQSIQ